MKKACKLAPLASVSWIGAIGIASAGALTEDECRAVWNTAAGRSDLSVQGAAPYIDDFPKVDTNADGKINNAEFKAGCSAGLVHKFQKTGTAD